MLCVLEESVAHSVPLSTAARGGSSSVERLIVLSVRAALAANALAVILEKGDWAVRVVRVIVRARKGVERLSGAVQAHGEDVWASAFQGDAAGMASSKLLLCDAHLGSAFSLLSSSAHAKVHGLVLVLRIFSRELLLVATV